MIAAFPARQQPEDEPKKLGFRWFARARTIGIFFIRSHIGEAPLHLHRGKSPLDGPRAGEPGGGAEGRTGFVHGPLPSAGRMPCRICDRGKAPELCAQGAPHSSGPGADTEARIDAGTGAAL